MSSPVTYIKDTILGTASANVAKKLDEHLDNVAKSVYTFHNWTWLVKSKELTLETDIKEYDLSGADNDLSKVVDVYYGEDMTPLSDEYPNRKAFYKRKYGETGGSTTPTHWVPDKRINEYTQRITIYPCSDSSLETAIYDYKKLFNIADVPLYPDPMVFVDGIMVRYLTGVAVNTGNAELAQRLALLARDYLKAYLAGREVMRENDSPVTEPKIRIDVSEASRRQLRAIKTLRDLRKWR